MDTLKKPRESDNFKLIIISEVWEISSLNKGKV